MKKILKKIKKNGEKLFKQKYHTKYQYAWYYKHGKVRENQVLFESFHGSTISDSPLYLLKELLKKGDYDIYYSTNDMELHKKFIEENNLPVKLVKINSIKYQWAMATSKYLINNSSFPSYFIRKEEQIYLQTWHGTPLKTLGKNMKKGIESMFNVQHNFLQANYLMFPNEFTRDAIMRDYNLNGLYTGKVVMCGYPRNNIFLDKENAKELRHQLGLENKTVYTYMPTWRGKSNHDIATNSYEDTITSMFEYLDQRLKDDQVLYVNFHPILRKKISLGNYKHILPFPNGVDNYAFLNCSDALITDYSSVFFDFSITRKPIILFMYDYEEYMADRGTYFDARTLPFTQIDNIEELTEMLANETCFCQNSIDETYYEKFVKYDTIDSGKELLEAVIFGQTDGMIIEDYSRNREAERKVIYPKQIKTHEQLEAVAKQAEVEHSIVVLEKKWFHDDLNKWMYEEYNDKFNYIVIYKNLVNTYMELVARKRKSQKVINEVKERGRKRCLPGLNISEDFNKYM